MPNRESVRTLQCGDDISSAMTEQSGLSLSALERVNAECSQNKYLALARPGFTVLKLPFTPHMATNAELRSISE